MSRETRCRAIVLKKQAFGESDEIITFFSRELGKIRCLAKSVKSSKSKLQQKLQGLFLVNLSFTHGKLPKIIYVETVKVFGQMRENLESLKRAFYAQELALKFTADEQKNEQLFFLLEDFLEFLNSSPADALLDLGLLKFKLEILRVLGLGVHNEIADGNHQPVFFSPIRGGFNRQASADSLKVSADVYRLFLELQIAEFINLSDIKNTSGETDLQNLLSQFIEYQLERKVRSEKFLRQ
jgi:DNA repair protein RecO (recombination protein O)